MRIAQAAKFAAPILPFLALFTAGPYAMYKTYTALDEAAASALVLEGIGILLVAGFIYLLKKIYLDDINWVLNATQSVREDLIIEEVQQSSLYRQVI